MDFSTIFGWLQAIIGPSVKPITVSTTTPPVAVPTAPLEPVTPPATTIVIPSTISVRAGLSLIKSFEGCVLTAYQDIVGVWTIGYGFTDGVHAGMVMTQEQADAQLITTYDLFEVAVRKVVTVKITANQLGALVSFTYNLGIAALLGSTLLRLLNGGSSASLVAAQFARWNMAGGKPVSGLTRRRAAECALFLQA